MSIDIFHKIFVNFLLADIQRGPCNIYATAGWIFRPLKKKIPCKHTFIIIWITGFIFGCKLLFIVCLHTFLHKCNLCFTSDGSLLVTWRKEHNFDSEDDSDDDNSYAGNYHRYLLTKYRVETGSASRGAALTQLWSVAEDDKVYSVAEFEIRLTFLSGTRNKFFYIL